jgi:hypothetical protein
VRVICRATFFSISLRGQIDPARKDSIIARPAQQPISVTVASFPPKMVQPPSRAWRFVSM